VIVRIIANPAAGRGQAVHVMHKAAHSLRGFGFDVQEVEPNSRESTRSAAADAALQGIEAVIACGGDGTAHDVLQSLVGTQTALGVLPAGSGDDVAGSLGLETDTLTSACAAIAHDLQGKMSRAVDVGVAEDAVGSRHYFASVLCTGFDARVNERANRMRRWWGHRYTLAMLRELASFKAMTYSVEAPGGLTSREAMIVSVGNGPRYGGGMRICPAADVHDNLLDITILNKVSRARLLWSFRLVFSGRHVELPFVETMRVRFAKISSPGAMAFADGELVGPLPVSISTLPGALNVVGSIREHPGTP